MSLPIRISIRPDGLYPKMSTPVRISWLLVLVIMSGLYPVKTDLFTSIHSLVNLFRNEEWLMHQINHNLEIYPDTTNRNVLERKMQDVLRSRRAESSMTESEWDDYVTDFIGHPVNAYHLIQFWCQVRQLLENFPRLYEVIIDGARERDVTLPEDLDYHGALQALVRLQKTYSLPTRELAAGRVYNVSAMYHLDKADCTEMGRKMMNEDHALALDWFDLLISMGIDDQALEREIYKNIIHIYKQCGDLKMALRYAQKTQLLQLDNVIEMDEIYQIQDQLFEGLNAGTYSNMHNYWSMPTNNPETYEQLCRGEGMTNSIFVNKDLVCIYRKGQLPYVQFKEEIHSFDPRISLMIDVITDKQADMLKSKAFPSLFRALIGDPLESVPSDIRISKLTWLWDTDPDVLKISQKVSHITGMSTQIKDLQSDAEAFQIVNYGMGGHYGPHYDFLEDYRMVDDLTGSLFGAGDRISTFMFYLSEVKAGGATVFPHIGVRVPPVKNAAAFWHNFQLHGEEGDRRTRHAGCPVLLGQKWVGNKWIRQTGQAFKRPCGLDKNQIDPIWYS